MQPDVLAVLAKTTQHFDRSGVPVLLGGSGLLWALGLVDEVRDLDLMAAAEDEDAVLAAAGQWLVSHTREGTDLWASAWFCELDVDGVAVDVIGGMAFRHPGGVARLPMREGARFGIDGGTASYADPALWWAVYRAYKPEKAVLLEAVVSPESRRRVCAELGL